MATSTELLRAAAHLRANNIAIANEQGIERFEPATAADILEAEAERLQARERQEIERERDEEFSASLRHDE